jgi:Spy/CpxP family protein refolding chaperone
MVKTWQVILATVAIFFAGLVTGGATALGVVRWVARHPRAGSDPFGPVQQRPGGAQAQQIGPQLMRSFANQLDLTVGQRLRMMVIVKRTAGQLNRDRREIQLTSALAIERMQDEIAEILTPGQRAKFEELIRQQRARLQEFKQNAQQAPQGPPPPPPEAPK